MLSMSMNVINSKSLSVGHLCPSSPSLSLVKRVMLLFRQLMLSSTTYLLGTVRPRCTSTSTTLPAL
ncbi:hypothetical protein OESDEN_05283 [Oesophagostomum dentatum]|uniref:Uncharacterized protein n=1 Tax=Oesophagostomum dentatum TaxID=61180 RepID=A0A0B1TB49_OESDE|nr:hypothetical protein OESDEN_05283 [Oesophagostomum dentatum]